MKIGILLSGRGSNMRAIVRAVRGGRIRGDVALVASNVIDAPGLAWARECGLRTASIPHTDYANREAHDRALLTEFRAAGVELVCLAGYMRLLGREFVAAFANRILNIHPSLLPSFKGLDAQRQALEHGVAVTGATVHLVDEELDHGPILLQEAVSVLAGDTEDSLSARILEVEHRIYPRAVALVCGEGVNLNGRRPLVRGAR